MNKPSDSARSIVTRRTFLRRSSLALSALPIARFAHAQGSGDIKLAMVGGGGRGSGAANQALHAYKGLKLVAIAELYKDRADIAIENLAKQNPDQVNVPEERRFLGFEAYKQAIAACDMVILATPCIFRPMMFEEAVRQGKNVFMEKPVAVDAPGVRQVLAAAISHAADTDSPLRAGRTLPEDRDQSCRHFIATPCGLAGPVANATLKSMSKRGSSTRRFLNTLTTCT